LPKHLQELITAQLPTPNAVVSSITVQVDQRDIRLADLA